MLSNKVCIVAGGGHGIGEATAIELGKQGATVVVNDLGADVTGEGEDEQPATETARAVEEAGGNSMAHFGDISSLDYTEKLVSDTVEEFGRVDGAVNFAGILRDGISYKMTGDEWDDVIRVHLRGHFALLRNLSAHWRALAAEEGGELNSQRSFLSVSSRSALGNVGQANYSAAKAGVLGHMRATSRELRRYNVRVNALMPTAYTRMIEEIPEEKRSFSEDEMSPGDVAPLVAYMMSDEAEDINGCTIRAAGDEVGIVTDPQLVRVGVKDGGWTPQDIAERFRGSIAGGIDLDREKREF